jgi:hypothetical protein
MAQYRLHHFWYVFKWVTQKQVLRLCQVCNRGTEVSAAELAKAGIKNPIPAYHRFSWAILPALFAGVIAIGALSDGDRSARTAELVATPRAGDTYVVDVGKLLRESDDKFRYGLMRVNAVRGGTIELALPKVTFNKVTGATRDLGTARTDGESYFSPKTVQVPITDLPQLQASGAIRSVHRN